jgi:transposase
MGKIIGIDMARNIFQRHAIGSGGTVVPDRQLRRGQVVGFCTKRGPCLIGLAAGATLHDWARKWKVLGHDVRLIPPIDVKPHSKRQKNDPADAEIICEAVQRPALRFVAVNNARQQGVLMLHGAPRTSGWPGHRLDQRSARGHFAEFGSVVAQGPQHGGRLVQRIMGRGGWGACHLRCPQRLLPWLQRCSASVPRSASLTRRSLRHTETTRPASLWRPSPAWRR